MFVYHWTHNWGGGTQKYIDELCKLFPNETHHIINGPPFQIDLNKAEVLHIHSTMVGMNIGWEVLNLVKYFKKVILTIHDYQWLFPNCPNPTTEDFENLEIPRENVKNFKELLKKCNTVFMHTENLLKRYEQYCGPLRGGDDTNILVTYPCDVPVYYERLFIPSSITNNKIKIGFLGGTAQHKGYYQFIDIVRKFYNDDEYEFHLYGANIHSPFVFSHGKYSDVDITKVIRNDGIHILLALSLSEETYCYALTKMINTGIPIVYLNRGSFIDRLSRRERFFPVDHLCDLSDGVLRAVNYVKNKGPVDYGYEEDTTTIIIPEKYKNIYTF